MEVTVRLVMLSDWHVGTGAGQYGSVDHAVQRDRAGLPYVPAKSVTGVWRDACELAAAALDGPGEPGGGAGSWRAWVEYLFGSQPALEERGVLSGDGGRGSGGHGPRPAALLVGSAHYPRSVAVALDGRPLLKASAVFLKPGVRIDPDTGVVEQGMLRFEEMGRCGAVLSAQVSLPELALLSASQRRAVRGLLAAGAGLVEGLGGKRRRGAGRCRLEVPGLEPDWEWLRNGPVAPPVPVPGPVPGPSPSAASDGARRERQEWEIADLRLVLEQPVVAHERTVGNAVRGLDHVPGWMLLPAILERIGSPTAVAAVRAGRLVVTSALPEIGGRPGRPVPLALVHAKDDPADQRNLMAEQPGYGFAGERFDGGYVGAYETDGAATAVPVWQGALSEHTHNTVDDPVQRPTERVGGLYTYQALAEGTVLRAQVRVPAGVLPEGWTRRLSGVWRLGRSRKDGYGRVRVTATEAVEPALRPVEPTAPLEVWLLSDVLVYDARLRPSTAPADLAEALGRALGVGLVPSAREADGRVTQAGDVRRHDPWHRRWGLPRNSLLGLKAGSCLRFDVTRGRLDPRAVARVETTGIGSRRAEGFGQVLLGDPLLSTPLARAAAPREHGGPLPLTSVAETGASGAGSGAEALDPDGVEAVAALEAMVTAAWRQEIHRESEALAADARGRERVLGEGHEKVPPAQLGALRALSHQLTGVADPRARAWLDRLSSTGTRRRAWPDAVREGLRRLLTEPDTVWELLRLPQDELSTDALPAARMREACWAPAVRTVVEDCLTAHARDRETTR